MKPKYIKLPQDKLREKYHCYGHFYTLQVKNKLIPCRSVLEIVEASSDLDNKIDQILKKPDAIAIMMNPGGSEPDMLNEPDYIETIIDGNFFSIDFINKTLVRAIPDTTQDRIMNIMSVREWRHVRILNLSDVREKNSTYLKEHLLKFKDASDSSVHSIFSAKRKGERDNALRIDDMPLIIFGWGTEACLEKVAEHAFKYITLNNNTKFVGIKQEKYNFYHPGRRKNWHDDILNQIFNL
ncbi:DUF1643 domain-containing protein [Clostridium beijerinckii]|uniref:DUF1643 domain-containing protein n=1 Tax=Clostridium beijerinckii TaxID=1520 RepID=UPI0004794872|nr:DUF1643 domain-containing protein [Clostridium beijerinckii]